MKTQSRRVAIALNLGLGVAGGVIALSAAQRLAMKMGLGGGNSLVWVVSEDRARGLRTGIDLAAFQRWRGQISAFASLEAFSTPDEKTAFVGARSARLKVSRATPGLLTMLGALPASGRLFGSLDYGADTVAVLGESGARLLFGSAAAAINQQVVVDRTPATVVGVLPADWRLPAETQAVDVFLPLSKAPEETGLAVGRLAPGGSLAAAQQELEALSGTRPPSMSGSKERLAARTAFQMLDQQTMAILWSVFAGTLLLVAVTVSNVLHLKQADDFAGRRELATRWALGASPLQLASASLRTGSVLAIAATIVSFLVMGASEGLLRGLAPISVRPFFQGQSWVWRIAVVGLNVGIIVLASLPRAVALSPSYLVRELRAGGNPPRRSRIGQAVADIQVTSTVASAVVLGVAALLVLATMLNLNRISPGFNATNLRAIRITLPSGRYAADEERSAFFRRLGERLATRRLSYALSTSLPPDTGVFVGDIAMGSTQLLNPPSVIGFSSVGAGYFSCIGQRILYGREFTQEDVASGARLVVVSDATARLFGGAAGALGQNLRLGTDDRTIVGVAQDVRVPGLTDSLRGLHAYVPLVRYRMTTFVTVRSPTPSYRPLGPTVASMDPDVAVEEASMSDVVSRPRETAQFLSGLTSLIAILALGMAVGGVYTTVDALAILHRRSIAIRMVLGATPSEMRRWLICRGLSRTLLGIGVGALASFPAGRTLGGHVFGIATDSSVARLAVALLVLGAAFVAIQVSARAAILAEPFQVLKEQ